MKDIEGLFDETKHLIGERDSYDRLDFFIRDSLLSIVQINSPEWK